MYEWVRGPLMWIAFITLIGGGAYKFRRRLTSVIKREAEPDAAFAPRSNLQRVVPFNRRHMRSHPAMALTSLLFHGCLLCTPLFLMGHAVLWRESWGISWWSLPENAATAVTVAILVGGAFFALQWSTVPEVRHQTTRSDWLFFGVVLVPFLTGFLAQQQVLPYKAMLVLHIVSGALWLIIIPFTRLFHMLWFGFSRVYMGIEFGRVSGAGN